MINNPVSGFRAKLSRWGALAGAGRHVTSAGASSGGAGQAMSRICCVGTFFTFCDDDKLEFPAAALAILI